MTSKNAGSSKKPVANPSSTLPSVLFALILIGAGVVLGRETLLRINAIDGPEWVAPALRHLDGLTAQQWMLPAGIAAAVIGLVLVIVALRPRRRTHRPMTQEDIWLRKDDVAALARVAALDTAGVESATAKARSKKVVVAVTSVNSTDTTTLKSTVAKTVEDALQPLASGPKVAARVRSTGHSS